jgi:hypothetical protein
MKQRSQYSDYAKGWEIRGSIPGSGKRFLSSTKRPHQLWGRANLILNGYWGSLKGEKWPGREAGASPPSRDDVKMSAALPVPPPPRSLQGVERDDFTFTFLRNVAHKLNTKTYY